MGAISTGIGLISGIDTASLISQLIALEARGKLPLQARIASLQAQQTALLDINARILNMKSSAKSFRTQDIFDKVAVSSNNESVLTATASTGAFPGNYTFIVDRLVNSSQHMTRGFNAQDSAIGITSMTFELGNGKLQSITELADLNGGDGISRGKIKITDALSASSTIDLSAVGEVSEVIDAINADDAIDVTASFDGDNLVLTDTSGGGGNLTVENVSGYTTATDLGIEGDDGGTGTLTGTAINQLGALTSLGKLNDGNGVLYSSGLDVSDFIITDRNGTDHNIVLGQYTNGADVEAAVSTIQDVIDRIATITSGDVTAAIAADGVSFELTDTTGGGGNFIVAGTGSYGDQTATDLGILNSGVASATISGDRVLAGINTVLTNRINGSSGLGVATTVTIQDRDGDSVTVANADTFDSLQDLINELNTQAAASNVDVTIGYNDAGSGLLATDTSGGSGNLIISGDAATALGIDTAGVAADSYRGTNVQHQYVAGSTLLSDYNYGRGVSTGTFSIIDADGSSANVVIGSDSTTLQDIIDEINSKGLAILASVNANGDGLYIDDTSGSGSLAITVTNVSGDTATDLNIEGTASDPVSANYIDGSYEHTVTFEATDTLEDIVTAIADANIPVSGSIINTGSGASPYRLAFTSEIEGSVGDLSVDGGTFDLSMTSLSDGEDARVFFGSTDPATGVLIKSTTNTLDDVVANVSIDLLSASSSPVTLAVTRNTEAIIDEVKNFIVTFNDVIGRLNQYDSYNADTEQRGILLGDPTVSRVRSAIYNTVNENAIGISTQFEYLVSVGIRIVEDGLLEMDESRFREALIDDREAVENLFIAYDVTTEDETLPGDIETGNTITTIHSQGVIEQFVELLENFTDTIDGTMTLADDNFAALIDATKDRIEAFDERLERRRQILQNQFLAMEKALAGLQAQQNSLGSLANSALLASVSGIRGSLG